MTGLFGDYDLLFSSGFRSQRCSYADSVTNCSIPGAEDRFKEAAYFASQMEAGYHDPQKFRYSLGGFLSAYGSISEILQKELERAGYWQKWKSHKAKIPEKLITNEYGPALTRARNVNIHQKSVFDGSVCEIGLYRGRRHKMSVGPHIPWDTPSPELIDRLWASAFGRMMLDDEHSAIGEQYGVRRVYRLKSIREHLPGDDKDLGILEIARRALMRTYDELGLTHTIDGEVVGLIDGSVIFNDFNYAQVSVLLESDVRPELVEKWKWPDLGEELKPIPNF
nr:hypothetical protein [Rhodococcus sp. 15-1154-1]